MDSFALYLEQVAMFQKGNVILGFWEGQKMWCHGEEKDEISSGDRTQDT